MFSSSFMKSYGKGDGSEDPRGSSTRRSDARSSVRTLSTNREPRPPHKMTAVSIAIRGLWPIWKDMQGMRQVGPVFGQALRMRCKLL